MQTPFADAARRHHRDALFWPAATALLADRVGGRWLALLGSGHPFGDWQVDQRYDRDDEVPADRDSIKAHAEASARAAAALDAALLDGWLR